MEESLVPVGELGRTHRVRFHRVHTLVVGSGAAGLNAAVQLRRSGVDDLLIVTEGLQMGTSINTGSDKQTYYKLSLCGHQADSPQLLAETLFAAGSMHGDLALVEAAGSARAFLNLVNLGVPFPRDRFGQFPGYKTDHDPRQRATSIGPYTSREMCRALQAEVCRLGIPVREGRNVVELLVLSDAEGAQRRAAGAIAVCDDGSLEAYLAENVVFAVGGFGGLYRRSVYPPVHTGAIGVALRAGVCAQNLPESQFGLASIGFRWNVSGTYMQVVPRVISVAADGQGAPTEFLQPYFDSPGQMCSQVFLKGYQWPLDARKAIGGSSLIDLLVYLETVLRGRRVFLDFRDNPSGFSFAQLGDEARQYLEKSQAMQPRPIERLAHMNPQAVELYRDHRIDLQSEPLEVAVCAQHNNGGLAGDCWWESVNTRHLFPVGEVNGSHGVARPGGCALNAGQVGGFRLAEVISHRYCRWTLDLESATRVATEQIAALLQWLHRAADAPNSWQQEREELQQRMDSAAGPIRAPERLDRAAAQAWEQVERVENRGCRFASAEESGQALRIRQLCFAQAVYLDAIRFAVSSGVGSRGSAVVLHPAGRPIHPKLDDSWRMEPENPLFREKVLETTVDFRRHGPPVVCNRWVDRRPIPDTDAWFETAWAQFRSGEIYDETGQQ